jgi:hypothetical protein
VELTIVTLRVVIRGAYYICCDSGDRGAYCSYCESGDRGSLL